MCLIINLSEIGSWVFGALVAHSTVSIHYIIQSQPIYVIYSPLQAK